MTNTKQHKATLSLQFQHHPMVEAALVSSLTTHSTYSVETTSLGLDNLHSNKHSYPQKITTYHQQLVTMARENEIKTKSLLLCKDSGDQRKL
jgi:hypothetical protein